MVTSHGDQPFDTGQLPSQFCGRMNKDGQILRADPVLARLISYRQEWHLQAILPTIDTAFFGSHHIHFRFYLIEVRRRRDSSVDPGAPAARPL